MARQLRTQYVEVIYTRKYYTVTLKSRLRVTQGHKKRNHWIDHTQLTIVELFDIERSRSLKMAPFDRPCKTFYWSVIVNIALILYHFRVI